MRLPVVPEDCRPNAHLFHVLLRDQRTRDEMMDHLRAQGIQAVFHYIPLHTSPMGRRLGQADVQLPVTNDVAGRLLRLPMYYSLTRDDQQRVVASIADFLRRAASVRVATAVPR